MTDEDFWEAVFRSTGVMDDEEYPDPDHEALDDFLGNGVCSTCGGVGACGWDMNGLPLVHPQSDFHDYVPGD